MNLTYRVDNFFKLRPLFLYALVFIISLTLFSYLQFDRTFADPDSFYHAKMAALLADRGIITQFPWLSATNFKTSFIDHHFLYHLALVPFVKIFPPLVGLKIATILFASLAILTIFWFSRQLKIKGAFWYAIFLMTVNPFVFRINLAKAQPLVLIFLFLTIYLLFTRRYSHLAIVSAAYVWLYGGWPLAGAAAGLYVMINWLWLYRPGWPAAFLRTWARKKVHKQNFRLLFSAGGGLLAGLLFNPYFPKNLAFYWQQTFKIALVNYQSVIGVGGEWYPYGVQDLFLAALPFFFFLIFALTGFFFFHKKQPLGAWFFFVLGFLFFLLTLKSRRYVEYFVPLALVFCALGLNPAIEVLEKNLNKILPPRYILLAPLFFLLAVSPIFVRDILSVKNSYRQSLPFEKFFEPAKWLEQNSQPGDIVFHSDWDEFPLLFYHNDKNYYLAGLDPTFMYQSDPALYRRWVDYTTGKTSAGLYSAIKNVFKARYVFVDIKQNQDFDRNLAANFNFKKVFENEEARVYQVLEP